VNEEEDLDLELYGMSPRVFAFYLIPFFSRQRTMYSAIWIGLLNITFPTIVALILEGFLNPSVKPYIIESILI
jgi:hypothetical protein